MYVAISVIVRVMICVMLVCCLTGMGLVIEDLCGGCEEDNEID
jgi:hypothetical protein